MSGGRVRKLLVIVILGALIGALLRALRGETAPQFSTHPSITGGPTSVPSTTSLVPVPAAPLVKMPRAEVVLVDEPAPAAESTWVDPVDGACPEGYPVKAKLKSGIYHQPGGLAYDRTKPDRCYPSAEAAEADGLRPPKR